MNASEASFLLLPSLPGTLQNQNLADYPTCCSTRNVFPCHPRRVSNRPFMPFLCSALLL